MLATIGFVITGLIVTMFASSFERNVAKPYKLNLWQFSAAYYGLALAFVIWGLASWINNSDVLRFSVLVGDGLLLAGSVLLLTIILPPLYRIKVGLLGGFLAIVLLCDRAVFYAPHPQIHNGILQFNSQRPVAIIFATVFSLLWLPVNIRVARLVTDAAKQPAIAQLYTSLYVAATLAALLFLSAKRTVTIALSFIAIGLMFALLVGSNYAIKNARQSGDHHGK